MTYQTRLHTMSCQYCDGDYSFEVEDPDYSVGIMGYQAFYCHNPKDHDNECIIARLCIGDTQFDEIEKYLNNNVSDYVSSYDEEP